MSRAGDFGVGVVAEAGWCAAGAAAAAIVTGAGASALAETIGAAAALAETIGAAAALFAYGAAYAQMLFRHRHRHRHRHGYGYAAVLCRTCSGEQKMLLRTETGYMLRPGARQEP